MDADNVGAPVSKQQWDYIHKMGEALRQSFENVSAVFAPSCISHSVLTKRDWIHVKVNDVSIAQAIHCWEQNPVAGVKPTRRRGHGSMLGDEPNLARKHVKKLGRNGHNNHNNNNKNNRRTSLSNDRSPSDGKNPNRMDEQTENKRRRRKKHKNKNNKRKNKKKKGRRQNGANKNRANHTSTITDADDRLRGQRSLLRMQQKQLAANGNGSCQTRNLESCSWPQCNGSCPKLHNPFTGEEMDLLELLQSFGVDMESVAKALGIDLATLNNMDHSELLNLLTQGKVKEA